MHVISNSVAYNIVLTICLFKVLEEVKVSHSKDRDTLVSVARTSLRTKLSQQVADLVTEVCACACLCVCVRVCLSYNFLLSSSLATATQHPYIIDCNYISTREYAYKLVQP